ncbi:MAG: zf-TFIIB domain-containing protein [Myxococcaceae bacterium]|jgi:ribosomal protein L40E|nr:zf-TFIIB domain-containing protein [Myxococcaceae bacterium]
MPSSPCPNCGAPLSSESSLFGAGRAGLACGACRATFADWAVTQQLFEVAGIPLPDVKAAVEGAAPRRADQAARTCPGCGQRLTAFRLKGIELDLCDGCGTTSFDPGELWRLTGGKVGDAPAMPKQGVFEMLWDCEHCDTRNLLGKTNRYCPSCGAPQDPKRRRFPEPGEEVAANTEFDGVDAVCPACSTANGAKAKHCRHCGSPMDGSAKVARLADQVNGRAEAAVARPAPVTPAKKARWPWVLGAAALMLCGLCSVGALWTKPSKATVAGHTWRRVIDVERFGPESGSDWCDSLPSGAYDVSRSKKQRSSNKVPDGETCKTRNVDRGDGTFERKQECTPKFRDEPVYDEHCRYTVDRWKKAREVEAKGSLGQAPSWPSVSGLKGGTGVGSEREGSRRETYTVAFTGPKGEAWSCDFDEGRWRGLREGASLDVKVRVMGGGLDCGSVR